MAVTVQDPADEHEAVTTDILDSLSPDDLETAARASYVYAKEGKISQRLFFAGLMASRYVESAGSDRLKALQKLKKTIMFRREKNIDSLRDAISVPISDYHIDLKKYLAQKHIYVQGFDREGRSTYIFVPRHCENHDPKWTLLGHVWTLERAIACSKARDQTVNAVVDFNGYCTAKNAPSLSLGREFLMVLRNHYVGHVHKIFLVDAPTAFMCLWSILKHFVGRLTRNKIIFVSSKWQKEQLIGRWYSPDEAASWMLPMGKKNRELDLEEYLHQIPFDRAFDE